jgi:transposase
MNQGGSSDKARVNNEGLLARASLSSAQGGRAMEEERTVFVGIDAAKAKHAAAVAEAGRRGEVRYLGEIEASPEAVRKPVTRLAARHGRLQVCYG